MSTFRLGIAGLAAAVTLAAAPASAQQVINLTIAASHPVQVPWVSAMANHIVPEIDRRLAADGGKYKINWRQAYGGVLYKANATLTSISDGIADMGWVFTNLEGARMPLAQVSTFTPGVTDDYRLMADVHNEMMDKVPALKAEWDKANAIFLGAMAVDTVHLFTIKPVKTIGDLKGRKISAAGTIGAWVGAIGATPVDGALPSFYNDIKTGVSEGGMTVSTGALGIKLYEVTPYIVTMNMGTFYAGALAINRDTYNKLPPEVQKVIREVGREYSAKVADGVDKGYQAAFRIFKEEGAKQNPPVQVTEFAQDERVKMFQGMPNIAQAWAKQNDAKGLPATQILKQYMDLMRARGAKPVRDWDKN
jgi:TRAP-type C4-dicarboxylate transport system substrate-binding protein